MSEHNILSKINDHTINSAKYFYEADSFKAEHEVWFSQLLIADNHKDP